MRQIQIPSIGDVLTLAEPWTLTVYWEHRNQSLVRLAGFDADALARARDWWEVRSLGQFTFPKGTQLTVDRIYIRKGNEEFDSMTFWAKGYTTTVRTGLKTKKAPSVRFWAKLADVNEMVVL